jgi:hypothetical protein
MRTRQARTFLTLAAGAVHGRRAPAAVLAFAVAALGAAPAAAQPPTLTGEVLTQHIAFAGSTTGNCVTDPATGTTSYSFDFLGPATGPYTGSFTESIQVTIGPPTVPLALNPFPGDGFPPGLVNPSQFLAAGQLLSFDATFAIDSPTGDVSGTKTLSAVVPADTTHAGVCAEFTNSPSPAGPVSGAYKDVRAFDLTYEATITSAEGTFRDAGTSEAQGRQGHIEGASGGVVSDVNDFGETFQSSMPQPPPINGTPGKGCGDKNHTHEREGECKKPPR